MIQIDSNIGPIATWLKAIEKIGQTKVRGVDFLGMTRGDNSGLTNADVAERIAKSEGMHRTSSPETTLTSRDCFAVSDSQKEEIAEAFAKQADKEIQTSADKITKRMTAGKKAISKEAASDKVATQIAAASFKKAMNKWQKIVVANMRGNKTIKGPATKVGEEYAGQRWRDHSVPEDDVFEATGDLLENMENNKAVKVTRG